MRHLTCDFYKILRRAHVRHEKVDIQVNLQSKQISVIIVKKKNLKKNGSHQLCKHVKTLINLL